MDTHFALVTVEMRRVDAPKSLQHAQMSEAQAEEMRLSRVVDECRIRTTCVAILRCARCSEVANIPILGLSLFIE